jgi:carboxyl-terminal processing protease
VFDRIKKAYVEDVDDTTLLNNAIRGMLSGLDPHSTYLEPQAFEELQESTSGEFGGLGIEVGLEDGFIRVISPIDDTPAQKAGLESGDLIIKLDSTSVKGMSLEEAVNAMRGAPGTTIVLTIIRQGEDGPIEVPVIRDVIRVTSVKQQTLEEGFGYVRITQFQAQTGTDFEKALKKLKAASPNGLKGVVMDLRNNPVVCCKPPLRWRIHCWTKA